jgi:hypothetical protein
MEEEAKKIYDSFYYCLLGSDNLEYEKRKYFAKQCSLILIDKLIEEMSINAYEECGAVIAYREIKEEIELL